MANAQAKTRDRVLRVVLIREIQIRYRGHPLQIPCPIRDAKQVVEFVRKVVDGDAREHLIGLYLDGRHQPIGFQRISIGIATGSLMHPREVFQPALGAGACGLILAHNHPSGIARPSPEDEGSAKRIATAGEILGIPLLDFITVGEGEYCSMKESAPDLLQPNAIPWTVAQTHISLGGSVEKETAA